MSAPVTVYEIKRVFRAPLGFAYAWCTDYTEADRKLQGDPGSRQLVDKSSRTVVYEDLNSTPDGWMWSRRDRDAPAAEPMARGRRWELPYLETRLHAARTSGRADGVHHARRTTATALGVKNPPKAVLEKELHTMWRNLGRALERDYRATRPKSVR